MQKVSLLIYCKDLQGFQINWYLTSHFYICENKKLKFEKGVTFINIHNFYRQTLDILMCAIIFAQMQNSL